MQRKCFHQKKWGVGNDLARTQHMNNDYRGMRPALIATPSQRARSWRTPLRAAKAQQERQLGGLSKLSKHGGLGDGTKRAAQQERRLGGLPKLSKNGGLGGPSKLSKNGGSVACQSSARTADLHGGLSKLGKSGRLGSLSKLSKNGCSVACQSSARTRTWWPVKARQNRPTWWPVKAQQERRTWWPVKAQQERRTW